MSLVHAPRYLVLAGPTASGKSALALEIAERFGGEIVNADSRQVYRFMDVGTAKPPPQDRRRVPHHLFDLVTPAESFDAARYHELARSTVREIAARGRLPVVVGGTGLYVRVLIHGLFAGPAALGPLRAWLARREAQSPGLLHRWCRRIDPAVAERIHPHDRIRLVRALEVALATGERMSEHQRRHGFSERLGSPLVLVVDPGAEELKRRIRRRSLELFERGLVEEVRSLWERGFGPDLRPMRSIGYVEAGRVVRGQRSLAGAVEDLVRSTERFAKRQRTWFRAEPDAVWVAPDADRRAIFDGARRLAQGGAAL